MIDFRSTSPAIWIAAILVVLLVGAGRSAVAQTTPQPPEVTIHIVQEGETLETIAALYGTTVGAIQEANAIADPLDIAVGQRLVVPGTQSVPAGLVSGTLIVAGLGDTLTTLAAQYNLTPEQLGRANKVVNPLRLYAGQIITMPEVGTRSASGLAILSTTSSLWRTAFDANANLIALELTNRISNPWSIGPGTIIVLPNASESSVGLPFPWNTLVLHPLPLEQGRTGGLRIRTSTPGTITASFLARDLQIVSSETSHEAVFGVDRWTEPGLYSLELTFVDETGTPWTLAKEVLVTSGDYATEVIRASEETSTLLGDPQSVQEEADYIKQNMSRFTPRRYWKGLFVLPVAGVMTSSFGTVRTYNSNDTITFHSGTDLAIKTGTPVYAPADGVVVDTGLLQVRGYATLLDHGAGVYTGYWHQASILVKPGDKVVAGQQIGTVGSTGFSTASHLHWEMWVGGVQVDPMQWVREIFP